MISLERLSFSSFKCLTVYPSRGIFLSFRSLLFSSKNVGAYPIVLLAKQDGYYKVQSDATLNSNRTSVTQDNGAYDFDLYYISQMALKMPKPPTIKPQLLGQYKCRLAQPIQQFVKLVTMLYHAVITTSLSQNERQ